MSPKRKKGTHHLVSFLKVTDPLVLETMKDLKEKRLGVCLHDLEWVGTYKTAPEMVASLGDYMREIQLRPGNKVTIVLKAKQIAEESICIQVIQRRFEETVDVHVMRVSEGETPTVIEGQVYYLSQTFDGERNRSFLVDYNYPVAPLSSSGGGGGGSGGCSSC